MPGITIGCSKPPNQFPELLPHAHRCPMGFLSFLVFSAQEPHIIFLILGVGYWCLNLSILLATADVAHRFLVRHIYEKCGVHNRQELIDLVEQAR